jgi:hypothetical protein
VRSGAYASCQHATSNGQIAQKKKPPAGGSQFNSGYRGSAAINADFDFALADNEF